MARLKRIIHGPEECRSELQSTYRSTHSWVRWVWVWEVLFYLVLLIALASSLADMGLYGQRQLEVVSLTVFFGLWYWFMVVRHRRWIQHTAPMLLYVAAAIPLCLTLIWLHPTYYMLLFLMYSQIYSFLDLRWAIPSSLVLTALLVVLNALESGTFEPAWVFPAVLSAAFGVFFALWIHAIIRQSRERQRLIDELESTRANLAAEERRAGVLEERGRLAREIHDTLAQGFISIVTHLEAAEESSPEEAQKHIEQAKRTSRENLVEARRLVAALRPEILEGSSLTEALGRLSENWAAASGIAVHFGVTGGEIPLAQETQVTILRTAQEALSNARRHAGAGEVNLTLSYTEDLVLLDVQDDGCGFDPSERERKGGGGFGLYAMRERIESLGGELSVESAEGAGTIIALRLPLTIEAVEAARAEEVQR